MKIMVCFDGSTPAIEAFELAKKHAKAFGGKIILTTSMKKESESDLKKIDKMEEMHKRIKRKVREDGIGCETHMLIRSATVGEDLLQFASWIKADEVIIGIKRRSKVEKLVFGSTAQFVILNAHCPVIAVK